MDQQSANALTPAEGVGKQTVGFASFQSGKANNRSAFFGNQYVATFDLRERHFDRVRMGLKRGAIFIEGHGCPPLQILKMRTLLDARRPDDHRVRT